MERVLQIKWVLTWKPEEWFFRYAPMRVPEDNDCWAHGIVLHEGKPEVDIFTQDLNEAVVFDSWRAAYRTRNDNNRFLAIHPLFWARVRNEAQIKMLIKPYCKKHRDN